VHECGCRHARTLGSDRCTAQHPVEHHDIRWLVCEQLGALAADIEHEREQAVA